jgi:hypothetical protein
LTQKQEEPKQFRLSVALAISVLLHVLLALLSVWAPVTRHVVAAPQEPEDTLLQFTFAPEVDQPADEPQQAEGVPFESEAVQPVPQPSFEPSGLPSLQPPSDEGMPLEEAPEQVEEVAEVLEPAEEPEPESASRADEASSALPELDDGSVARNEEQAQAEDPTEQEQTTPQIDLNRALRDFGQAVNRARAEQPPSEQGGGQARNVFTPDPASFPPTGFGAGNLVFESRDFDWSDYARQIYVALWRAWHNRLYHTTEDFEKWAHTNRNWFLAHQSQVRFVIERSGQVTGIQLEVPAGCLPRDESAIDALVEVILPPLPADFPRDQEVVHVRFIANGPIGQMRPTLTQLKRMGLF